MKDPQKLVLNLLATLVFSSLTQAQSSGSIPVFKITPVVSKITFYVFTSTDASTGVLFAGSADLTLNRAD